MILLHDGLLKYNEVNFVLLNLNTARILKLMFINLSVVFTSINIPVADNWSLIFSLDLFLIQCHYLNAGLQ